MAETSKNKIYYNDNEDSIADVLEDMKKLAESTDNAIEKAKYNDIELKNKNTTQDKEIAQIKEKDTAQDNLIEKLQAENTKLKKEINSMQIPGEATGNPIHLTDSSDLECEIVPIGGAEQETRKGYNLLPNLVETQTIEGINITKNEDGSIKLKGTSTNTINLNINSSEKYVKLKANTNYTLNIKNNSGIYVRLRKVDENTNIVAFDTPNSKKTFSVNEDTTAFMYIVILKETTLDLTIYPMVYEGTEDKPYEPYGAMPSPDYPSEIVTVGQNGSVEIVVNNGLETTDTNYQSYTKTLPIQEEMLEGDYIEDVEHHGWGKYEITGNEVWRKSSNSKNISYFLVANSMLVNIDTKTLSPSVSDSQTKVAIVLSNYFKAISPNQLFVVGENGICLNLYNNEIQMRLGFGLDSDINTVDKLKAWLKSLYDAGTPVIVYYKLATPKSLELTEDQKSVLNSFYTYKNITNISVDGIGTLKVNYKKDLETIINKLSATSVAE